MKRLFASAVFLSVVFTTDFPLVGTTTAFAAGGLSSSYRYLRGIGKVNYKTFLDAGKGIVLHDFNGDGYTDVGVPIGGHVRTNCSLKPPGVCNSKCTYKSGCKTIVGRAEIFLNDRRGRLLLKTKQAFQGKPMVWRNGLPMHITVAYDPEENGKSTLADITGDGRADWLAFNSLNDRYPKRTRIIQTRSTGKLKVGPRHTPLITYHSGSLADIDKDGDLDLIISLTRTFIYYNNGRGKFSCDRILPASTFGEGGARCYDQLDWNQPDLQPNRGWSFSNLAIDLNGDGLPEVITAHHNDVDVNLKDPYPSASGKILVFKNTGGKLGTFKKV